MADFVAVDLRVSDGIIHVIDTILLSFVPWRRLRHERAPGFIARGPLD